MADYGYSSVPGSAKLKTKSRGSDKSVAELDALDSSATAGRWVCGEWLCRSVVRTGFVPVLKDVFDRLLPLHQAEEAATYIQLFRLSYGDEKNWCRVSRRDLANRTNLSDRRLGGALAGLVKLNHLKLLHRDRRGTLYRVFLPHEVFGEPDQDFIFAARPRRQPPKDYDKRTLSKHHSKGVQSSPEEVQSSREEDQPSPEEVTSTAQLQPAKEGKKRDEKRDEKRGEKRDEKRGEKRGTKERLTVGAVAATFLKKHGAKGREMALVVESILDALEQGATLKEVATALETFGNQAPKRLPIGEFYRWFESSENASKSAAQEKPD